MAIANRLSTCCQPLTFPAAAAVPKPEYLAWPRAKVFRKERPFTGHALDHTAQGARHTALPAAAHQPTRA